MWLLFINSNKDRNITRDKCYTLTAISDPLRIYEDLETGS